MAKHTLMIPDFRVGRDLRSIVWDDEAGTVEGEHSRLYELREVFAEPTPYIIGGMPCYWELEDPAHNPADFLRALSGFIDWQILYEPLRSTLPPVFDGVEPTPPTYYEIPEGAIA